MFKARFAALFAAAMAGAAALGTPSDRPYVGRRPKAILRNTPEIEAWNRAVEARKREKLKAKLARRAERLK